MSTLQEQFEAAVAESKTLPERPDNMTLLKMYGLYKQGSNGDVQGERPGMTDFVGPRQVRRLGRAQGQATGPGAAGIHRHLQ